MKTEINYNRNCVPHAESWRLNNIISSDVWTIKKIKKKMSKVLETNRDKGNAQAISQLKLNVN